MILPPALDNARVRERLTAAALRTGVAAFETRGRRLHALGVVGVVDIGEVIVEILPKTSDAASRSDDAAFLGALLRFVGAPDDLGLSDAGVAGKDGDLLEVVFTWASRLAARLLEDGAPRRYAVKEERSSAVRGRVELRHLVRQRPGRAFELVVRHAPLSDDNPMSRVVRWLLATIAARTRNLTTRGLCQRLLDRLGDVGVLTPDLHDLERLVPTPLEAPWRPLLGLARLFLLQDRPDPSRGGSAPAVAVLFPLHGLFEAAVRRVLREGEDDGLRLTRAGGFLLRDAEGAGLIDLRPDFALGAEGRTMVVGDAKWKRIFDGDGPARPAERDVYQLTAYVAAFRANAGFLVSPLSGGAGTDLRRSSYRLRGLDRPVEIIGVRLATLIAPDAAGRSLRADLRAAVADLNLAATPVPA